MPPLPRLKLPRQLESNPHHDEIEKILKQDFRPIWEESEHRVAFVPFTPALETALLQTRDYKGLEIGLETIQRILRIEKKGLDAVAEKQGSAPAHRVSRVLIASNDGAERFYRDCEKILINNSERLLFICVDVPSERLGEKLIGSDRSVKALLVSDKVCVSNVLLSLAGITT